jgi:hypothetical protein
VNINGTRVFLASGWVIWDCPVGLVLFFGWIEDEIFLHSLPTNFEP